MYKKFQAISNIFLQYTHNFVLIYVLYLLNFFVINLIRLHFNIHDLFLLIIYDLRNLSSLFILIKLLKSLMEHHNDIYNANVKEQSHELE
jgi:hypothetical protein